MRVVACSLSLLLLVPYASLPASAAPGNNAPATPAPASALPDNTGKALCVLDFSDLSRSGGEGLGRMAAGRFSSQLEEMQRWTVLPDARLRERVTKLSLAMPLDRAARVRLAADAGSDQVIYGTITTARLQEKPAGQAYVRMMVLIEDAKTGELLQGAISEGTSALNQPTTVTREQLFTEAMGNAAASFARYLAEPKAPVAPEAPATPAAAVDRSVQADAPAPPREPIATATRIVTDKEAQQVFASVGTPTPVVIDIPNTGLEAGGTVRRPLISNRTLKLLVGGLLFAGLLYIGGGGGIGSTRPF
jgi:hypothetical protein